VSSANEATAIQVAIPSEEATKDLGIGSKVLARSEARFLNPDGSFNVVRAGLPFWRSLSAYHWLLTISWPAFFGVVCLGYFATNLMFALAYIACGPNALQGLSDVQNPESRFWESFFFSVHTLATIGYGTLSPRSFPAHVVVTFEALFGLLGFALATGLLFARFSRPTAKVLFSNQAVVAPYGAGRGLMFRIVNARRSQLLDVAATVSIGWAERVDGRLKRRFEPLPLERAKVTFFPLHWVVVHPIDAKSPLMRMSAEELKASHAEVFVMLSAVDETFAQTVYARRSYRADEIVWNARFADVFIEPGEGRVGIDVRKLHDIERL
jgi:inward rectifier potassium channel